MERSMNKPIVFMLAAFILSFSVMTSQAFAMDLATAKKEGLIGEQSDGLVGVVFSNPTPEILALVESTNKGRMAVYQDMANKQGLTLLQIREIATIKILEKELPGNYIRINGEWAVKSAR
jgi:uncharacterized protein YdbL (DUF1318 family)